MSGNEGVTGCGVEEAGWASVEAKMSFMAMVVGVGQLEVAWQWEGQEAADVGG
jgi:hypothetical protein